METSRKPGTSSNRTSRSRWRTIARPWITWRSSRSSGGERVADEIVSLTKGARYRIESMETRERTKETKGVFRGYATIGTDDAIVVELDDSHQKLKGKLRLSPLRAVLAVDVLGQTP